MASDKYASFNSAKESSALESKFVNLPSTLASYVKSKYQAWYILSKTWKILLSSSVKCRGPWYICLRDVPFLSVCDIHYHTTPALLRGSNCFEEYPFDLIFPRFKWKTLGQASSVLSSATAGSPRARRITRLSGNSRRLFREENRYQVNQTKNKSK